MGELFVMKLPLVCVMIFAACVSCNKPEEAVDASASPGEEAEAARPSRPALEPREFWVSLEHELDHYVAEYPGRPILLSVSAKWSSTSTLAWRVLFSDEATETLRSSGFVCVVGDVTEGDEVGRNVMKSLGYVAVPVTAIYDPVAGAWQVKPGVFSAADVKEWVSSLQRRMAGEGELPPRALKE